ncbi:MAG: heavy-metal-associated domain-containing protein [Methylococcales bacterium]|nr:heavy-metal-associated domain-containing protein [Methylococcales bacterium]
MSTAITLNVDGMKCGGCEQNLTTALTELAGVEQVKASHSDNTVAITYDETRLDQAAIAGAIQQAGFTLR